MLNSVVDIAGINRISRPILSEAAAAMAGMVKARSSSPQSAIRNPQSTTARSIAATMFGVTTPCVQHARKILEEAGYEVLVFHATGNGGQAMESLIRDGLIAGVLDITTTELADELVGGILSAGPDRLTAAGRDGHAAGRFRRRARHGQFRPARDRAREIRGPQVPRPQRQRHADADDAARKTPNSARKSAAKLAAADGPAAILLPLQGVSAIDRAGQPFDDPAARTALFDAIRAHHGERRVDRTRRHINDRGVRRSGGRQTA